VDIGTLIVTNALSLVVGLVGGYALQWTARQRARQERKALSDLGTIERCIDIFNARVEYIIAYHTARPDARQRRQEEYHALYYGNLHALPETHVPGDIWQIWMRAERNARDTARPMRDRIDEVKQARVEVLAWLGHERAKLETAI
jgi:hypothetical protein